MRWAAGKKLTQDAAAQRVGKGRATVALVRPSGLAVLVATDGAVLVAGLLGVTVLGVAFNAVRTITREGLEPWLVAIAIALLSIAWVGALWLLAIATAWRSAAWTFEVGRRIPALTIESAAIVAQDPDD